VWGIDGNKAAADVTDREIEFLKAAATDLQDNTQKMFDSWRNDGENYAANFAYAKTGSIFRRKNRPWSKSQRAAALGNKVADEKIGQPLSGNSGAPKPEAEESRLSNNTKQDLANNILGIKIFIWATLMEQTEWG
jgi:predicted lipoprotein